MSLNDLSSRAVAGMFFERMERSPEFNWVNAIANLWGSDQDVETYKMIGQVPTLREWIGGRQPKGLRLDGFSLANLHYESTLEFLIKDLRRDKTGQIQARINEFADSALSHWAKLLSVLIENAETGLAYDGQYFFDTDHVLGSSGTMDNDLSVDISALAVTNHGSTTAPSVGEMAICILKAVQQMYAFKDDQGEPINEFARKFLVMVPVPLFHAAVAATNNMLIDSGESNTLKALEAKGYTVEVAANPRLTWTTKLAVFRTDSEIKPLIRQEETGVMLKVKDESSEFAFDNDAIQLGIDTWRNAGYGRFQGACMVTMT